MGTENPPTPPADPTDQTDWSRLRERLEQPGAPNVTNMTGLRGRLERSRMARQSKKPPPLPTHPDYGREIPPRLNPDVPAMVKWLKQGYRDILAGAAEFRQQIATLTTDNKLGYEEFEDLRVHYRALNDAVNQALFFAENLDRRVRCR